jgi:hypothetical protein
MAGTSPAMTEPENGVGTAPYAEEKTEQLNAEVASARLH